MNQTLTHKPIMAVAFLSDSYKKEHLETMVDIECNVVNEENSHDKIKKKEKRSIENLEEISNNTTKEEEKKHNQFVKELRDECSNLSVEDKKDKNKWTQLDKKICNYLCPTNSFLEKLFDAGLYIGINKYDSRIRNKLVEIEKKHSTLKKDISERIYKLKGEDGLTQKIEESENRLKEVGKYYRIGEAILERYEAHINQIDYRLKQSNGEENMNLKKERKRVEKEYISKKEDQDDISIEILKENSRYQTNLREAKRLKIEINACKRKLGTNESMLIMMNDYFNAKQGMMNTRKLYSTMQTMREDNTSMHTSLELIDSTFSDEIDTLCAFQKDSYLEYDSSKINSKIDEVSKDERRVYNNQAESILSNIGI